mmetsp:Transcript_11356/g.21255  ORF Transcript_11356/g.21255 Transcript_11356/m.21255 type:complete len:163 (+) Transcript_11356:1239-1727(+)
MEEFPSTARLHMCTIGSSHKLPTASNISERTSHFSDDEFDIDDDYDIDDAFGRMNLNERKASITVHRKRESVVIFDEAGCIRSYELLGLSRLGLDIKSLLLVGDKHQLPPYDSSSQQGTSALNNSATKKKKSSLLDISVLSQSGHKTNLTTQYRVPKDIDVF